MTDIDTERTQQAALQIRRDVLRMINGVGSGHPGGALGAADILAVLYGGIMRVSPEASADPDRDRLILSNGHICAAWYSALSLAGFIPREELGTFRKLGTRLQGHPSRRHIPDLVDASTGPLGQGFAVANGLALGLGMAKSPARVFCLVGDGEMQEGIVWEALMTSAQHGLASMNLIVLKNELQIDGAVASIKSIDPLDKRLESFGWEVRTIDGHDHKALAAAFAAPDRASTPAAGSAPGSVSGRIPAGRGKPRAFIARTVMSKGVPFMENDPAWHGGCPNADQTKRALEALGTSGIFADYPDPRRAS